MKANAWIAMLALTLTASGQGPFPMSDPVIQCCTLGGGGSYAVADFNGDGLEDFASNAGPGLVCTLASSAGGYGPSAAVATFTAVNQSVVHGAADLTGDGNADILCSTFAYSTAAWTTWVYPGTGAGQFGAPLVVPDPSSPGFHRVFLNPGLSGLTPPGVPAIVLCSTHSSSGGPTFINVYTMAFQAGSYSVAASLVVAAPPQLSTSGSFQFWHAGDVNGDGLLDLVGTGIAPSSQQWDWILLLGTGAPLLRRTGLGLGTDGSRGELRARGREQRRNGRRGERVHEQPPRLLLADARPRLLSRRGIARKAGAAITTVPLYQAIDVAVYSGHPTAPLGTFALSITGVASNPYPVVEDFDGDGNRDLMLSIDPAPGAPVSWPIAFSRGDGHGHFGPALPLQSSVSVSAIQKIAPDVNGDGLKDLVPLGYPFVVLYNQAKLGPGLPGAGGVVPQTTVGLATPGNPAYHVGVVNAAPSSPAALGVSFGMSASSPVIDLAAQILVAPFGAFTTNAVGSATWVLALPPAPALVAQTVYLQWAVIEPGSPYGYSLTPARKVVFW